MDTQKRATGSGAAAIGMSSASMMPLFSCVSLSETTAMQLPSDPASAADLPR